MSHYDDQEMSMEEILASIRRYVSDEGPIDPLPPPTPKPIKLRPDQVVRDGFAPVHPQTQSSHPYLPGDSSFPTQTPSTPSYPHEYVREEPQDYRGLPPQESARVTASTQVSIPPQKEDVKERSVSEQHFPLNDKEPHSKTNIEPKQSEPPVPIPVASQTVSKTPQEKATLEPPSFLAPQAFEASLHAFSKLTESLEKAQMSNSTDSENTNVTLIHFLKALMAPQIKAWLDQNLPTLVEEIVRQEVEKITSHLTKNF